MVKNKTHTIAERSLIADAPELTKILFQEHPDGVYLIDMLGFFVDGNPMAEIITGYKKEELIGRHFLKSKLLPLSQLPKAVSLFTHVMTSKDVTSEELTLIRKDKSHVHVELRARLVTIDGKTYILGSARDITERDISRQALATSEAKWKAVVTNSQPIIFVLDAQGIFMVSEGKSLASIGLKPGEVVGLSAYEIYKDYPLIINAIRDALDGQTTNPKFSVGTTYFDSFFSPMTDEQDHVIGVLGMAIDITEKEEAQIKILGFNKLIETSLNEIYVFSADSLKFLEVNQGARDNLGYSLEELKKLTPLDLKPEITAIQFTELIAPLRTREKKFISFHTIHKRKDNSTYPVEVSLQLIDIDQPVYVAMIIDTTEREKAEQSIREKEANYQTLFHQIADPIVIFDAKTHYFLDCNQTAIDRYGYTLEEFRTMTPHNLHPPEDLEKVGKNIDDKTSSSPNEYVHISKDRTQFNVEIHTQEIVYQGEGAWISIIRDITERKRVEQELHAAKLRAEESDRLKSAFLANMSHEIRTPMNAILGFTELLEDPDILPEEKLQFGKLIHDSGERLMALINDLIDISKIEAGQIRLNKQLTPLQPLLSTMHLMFQKEAKGKGLELVFVMTDAQHQDSIYTDRDRLNQILINLIKNAIKFTHEGSVTFGYHKRKSAIEFFVTDTGIGIDEELHGPIFDRFIQGEVSYSKKYEGTGLGLSITKALVELLGGEIWLQSVRGKGTTFFFTHPGELL